MLLLVLHPDGAISVQSKRLSESSAISFEHAIGRPPAVKGGRGRSGRHSGSRSSLQTLEVKNVTVRFGGVVAVDDVSLSVKPGEIVGLIGPNGAGKTTMIDAVTGFVKPAAGEVLLDGKPVRPLSTAKAGAGGIGRSFQSLELFEAMLRRREPHGRLGSARALAVLPPRHRQAR